MDKKCMSLFAFVSMIAVVVVSACIQLPDGGRNACAQVITPAVSPDGAECKDFATPCDVPGDWTRVGSCPETCPKGEVCRGETNQPL